MISHAHGRHPWARKKKKVPLSNPEVTERFIELIRKFLLHFELYDQSLKEYRDKQALISWWFVPMVPLFVIIFRIHHLFHRLSWCAWRFAKPAKKPETATIFIKLWTSFLVKHQIERGKKLIFF